MKEGFAFTLQRAGLVLDSLLRYQELESLLDTLNERKLKMKDENQPKLFEYFIQDNQSKKDSSLTVQNYPSLSNLLKKKPELREEMYKNTISEFSLRCYLFSRLSDLFYELKQPNKVASMAISFIREMYKELKKHQISEKFFCERWAYQGYIDIINDCDFYYNLLLQENQQSEVGFDIPIKALNDLFKFSDAILNPSEHNLLIAHLHYLSRKMVKNSFFF